MRTKLLPILLALGLTTSALPAHANFFNLNPSEESVLVSVLVIALPIGASMSVVQDIFHSLGKLSETHTPLVITKLEPTTDGKYINVAATANNETINFKTQGKGLERAGVTVGTQVYTRQTKAGYVLENNDIVIGVITDQQSLLKQERVR